MKTRKVAPFAILLILASLLSSGCTAKQSGAQVQSLATTGDSLIVIDASGNALPIVFRFSRQVSSVKYYQSDGKEQTKQEISSSLEAQGMTAEEVNGIWGTSIADLFNLFTHTQLYERSSRGAASNAALLYDMWQCLTNGPSEIREDPGAILEGLVPNETMRPVVFDFLEQRKHASLGY